MSSFNSEEIMNQLRIELVELFIKNDIKETDYLGQIECVDTFQQDSRNNKTDPKMIIKNKMCELMKKMIFKKLSNDPN
jgi:hypothetical protein